MQVSQKMEDIGKYVMLKTALEPADVGLVFGTPHSCDIFAAQILSLWEKKFFSRILLTGGSIIKHLGKKESSYLAELLHEAGIPANCIYKEVQSTNTGENVEFAVPILQKEFKNLRSIMGIGKIFSTRRCLMTLQKYFPSTKKMFFPINTFGVPDEKWYESPELKKKVYTEYSKIPLYLSKGYIEEVNEDEYLLIRNYQDTV